MADDLVIKGAAGRRTKEVVDDDLAHTARGKEDPREEGNKGAHKSTETDESVIIESTTKRARSPSEEGEEADESPPLPDSPPPLPDEEPVDDGWDALQDPASGGWYFYNRHTGISQWHNPRVADSAAQELAPGTVQDHGPPGAEGNRNNHVLNEPPAEYKGYNPKIHGDFDPNADYADFHKPEGESEADATTSADLIGTYEQSATFNRFTGKFQGQDKTSEHHNDENKSRRQMQAFFDPDAAANAHGGQSLKAERSKRKLSKKEVQEFNDKKKRRKQDKQMAFLKS